MANTSAISVANLDFDEIKSNLKTFLKNQAIFQDYDFEGSNLSVLLDVLSYNTFMNNYYLNQVANEGFLDSAQLIESVVSHAKTLNYLPQSHSSARAKLSVEIVPDDVPPTITIPQHTKWTASVNNVSYTFSTNNDIVISANGSGNYVNNDVDIYEGSVVTEFFNVDIANTNQKYVLSANSIDTSSLSVKVRVSNTVSTNATWTQQKTILGLDGSSNAYFVQPNGQHKYELQFGDGTVGRALKTGNVIEATYRKSNGDLPNGAQVFNFTGSIDTYSNVIFSTVSSAEGGSVSESIDDIKFNAPKNLTIQDRLITKQDYETLIKQEFSDIESISVFGGEEADPPEFGKVIISVDVKDADGVPESTSQKIKDFADERSALGITSKVITPEFLFADVAQTVRYNVNESKKVPGDIISLTAAAANTFAETFINDFNKTFRISKFDSAIDAADPSILSSDNQITIRKDWIANTGAPQSITIDFNNEIDKDVKDEKSGITSTPFTFGSTTNSTIRDDGKGILQVVRKDALGDTVVLDTNIGTIDYTTGIVRIAGLSINNYSTSSIQITARPQNRDISSTKNIILKLGTVTTSVIQEAV